MTWAPEQTQKSIYETLTADAALMALLLTTVGGAQKVFDHIPDNSPYPYVSLRIKPMTDRANESWDGVQINVQIDVWYQYSGLGDLKVQQIQKRIDELLHDNNTMCIDGWNIVSFRRQTVTILDEPDGRTKHGVQIFNLFLGGA
jgi:hypothetical protein